MLSYLDIVNQVDSFPYSTIGLQRISELTLFIHGPYTLGYILPNVAAALKDTPLSGSHWIITPSTISIIGSTADERTENIRRTVESWRAAGTFKILSGWRNELYSVYCSGGELYFCIERSAAALFGVVTYGVHMTAYVPPSPSSPLRIWTPRRSLGKSTYGGMLDNTVAGGIASGMGVFDTLVKEGGEEASLPAELIIAKAKGVGMVSYFYQREKSAGGEIGLLQPEVEYVFDLELGEDIVPKPCDDEVQEFILMPVDDIKEELAKGNFKPNCAIVLIDFFIRHGIITAENELDYIEIVCRTHRKLEFPLARVSLAA